MSGIYDKQIDKYKEVVAENPAMVQELDRLQLSTRCITAIFLAPSIGHMSMDAIYEMIMDLAPVTLYIDADNSVKAIVAYRKSIIHDRIRDGFKRYIDGKVMAS